MLSKAVDAAVPALATYAGQPTAAVPARAAIKTLTGVGVYDSYSDKEGGRISVDDVKKAAKSALGYAPGRGIIIDVVDAGDQYLLSKAT
ncbi:unnamed protein product [Phytophthora fragariaefolia]|uniref:Unnamed protein product n=1 Tax=Phytophthora fragariaefolia TaxID=1490495 RepID=A0A9W6UD85_9STRA|nr:unnamed protein product [Phytophthora fragariaefolia]